jgi:hypothetical protein
MEWREDGIATMPALPSLPVRGRDAQLASLEEHPGRSVRVSARSCSSRVDLSLGKTRLLPPWACAEGMALRIGRGMADPMDVGTAAVLRSLPQQLASLPMAWFLTTRPRQGSAQILTALAELVDGGADMGGP